MIYNEIGKTGMKVSNLGFGASSLGGVFHSIREEEGIEAVHTAVDNGINFIDVSPYYGHLKAETVLGKALKDIPHEKYYLSTKVGRYGHNGINTWDYSAKRAQESVYESMERLNVDYIDLINVHDIEFQGDMEGGLQLIVDETLPALVELRDKGVVKHVGITDLQPENLKWVVEHAEHTELLPLLAQRHPAGRLSGILRAARCGCDQCFAILDGTAVAAWCSRLAPGWQGSAASMRQGSSILRGAGLPNRQAGHTVLYQHESTYRNNSV